MGEKRAEVLKLAAILAGIVAAGLIIPPSLRVASWFIVLGLMTMFVVTAGKSVTGLSRGFLIDSRNKMSLSRFQMLVWTLVVLSGYLTAALSNVRAGVEDPLAIAIPESLWILMGISMVSLIGSPLLLSDKARRLPDEDEFLRTIANMHHDERGCIEGCTLDGGLEAESASLVVRKRAQADATWTDLFRGEETGNAAHMDLAKIQMFFFTFVLVLAYAAALARIFSARSGVVNEFPVLHAGMTAVLGISHTGYLAGKALPHSREGDPAPLAGRKKKKAGKRSTRVEE